MDNNKYYDSWQEWKRLCDDYEHGLEIDDFLDQVEKAYNGFSEAFVNAKKWDRLIDGLMDVVDKDDVVNLEYGRES